MSATLSVRQSHTERTAGQSDLRSTEEGADEGTDTDSSSEEDIQAKRMEKFHERYARMFKRDSKDKDSDTDKDKGKGNDNGKDKDTDSDSSDEEADKNKKYGGPDHTYGNSSTVKATNQQLRLLNTNKHK